MTYGGELDETKRPGAKRLPDRDGAELSALAGDRMGVRVEGDRVVLEMRLRAFVYGWPPAAEPFPARDLDAVLLPLRGERVRVTIERVE